MGGIATGYHATPVRLVRPACATSIPVLLTQPRAEAQHELHPLDLVHPVGQRRAHLIEVRPADARRAGGPELLLRDRAVAVDRPVAVQPAELVILRQK